MESAQLLTAANASRFQEDYHYDIVGNVVQRTHYWDSVGFGETFDYDELDRLKSSQVTGRTAQIYSYDAGGNLKSKTGAGTGDYVYPAQGATAVQPHAVQSIPGIGSFAYDANGNMKSGAGRTMTWKSFDMPDTITKGAMSASFAYGPEHQRTRQTRQDGSVTVYAGSQEVERNGAGTQVTVKTYWPGGIGVEIDRPGQATELNWTHADHLGSVAAITDAAGNVKEKLEYDAWGKRRTPDGSATPDSLDGQVDNKGYTGHEMLDRLDLVHMNGRVYDPFTGTFISADPLISDPANGQDLNRYSYALNNPVNVIDPTGMQEQTLPEIRVTAPRPDRWADNMRISMDLFVLNSTFRPVNSIFRQEARRSATSSGVFASGSILRKPANAGQRVRNTIGVGADIGIGFTPAGVYADVYGAVMGETLFGGQTLEWWERGLGLIPLVSESIQILRGMDKAADALSGAKGAGRSGALNAAKSDLGIPRSQHPDSIDRIPMTDRNGKSILGADGKPIMTREYTYTRPDGSQVVVQDHSAGHRFGQGGVGDQGSLRCTVNSGHSRFKRPVHFC